MNVRSNKMNQTKKMSAGKITGFVFLGLFVLFLFSGGCFFLGIFAGSFGTTGQGGIGLAATANSIYVIDMEGVISGTESTGLLAQATVTPEYMIDQFVAAERNPGVKAILIRVNSGGGSSAASQEIFEELKKVKKPVVVSVGDVCASGAYYISCAADSIVANRSSAVGSIGVILQVPNFEELYEKLGIEYTTIKQGKYKDAGSTDRPLTEEEKTLLEEQTFKIYEQFIQDVAETRGLPVEKVKEIATGWVYLGTEAKDLGLIDVIGTYKDAEIIAAELGGIRGEPYILERQQFSLFDMLMGYYLGQGRPNILDFRQDQAYPLYK
jgi:protease-4